MNIATEVDDSIYDCISINYEKENYTGAVLDAILFLTARIKDKGNIDGDGAALVGMALGGENPPIKLSKLQTESEKNLQKGVEQILRGIYQGIRNPRSHEKMQDTKQDADSIILFINYLFCLIKLAADPFSTDKYIERVLDRNFVEDEKYAELMVSEIPAKKATEILYSVYNRIEEGQAMPMKLFFSALIGRLGEEEKADFFTSVSEELKTTNSEPRIRKIVKVLGNDNWVNIDSLSRMRIENMLLKSINEGKYQPDRDKCDGGSFGTWAKNIFDTALMKEKIRLQLISKLSNPNKAEQDYVFQYFEDCVFETDKKPSNSLLKTIQRALIAGDIRFYDLILWHIDNEKMMWPQEIVNAYKEFKEKENDWTDDIPF